MNDSSKKTSLNKLINQYQETKAPMGFADRVSARMEEKPRHELPAFAKLAYGTSFAVVVLVSVYVLESDDQSPSENSPNNIIAQKAEPTQETPIQSELTQPKPVVKKEQKTQLAKIEEKAAIPVVKEKRSVTVHITKAESTLFFDSTTEVDDSSLAVLTDISDWLADGQETSIPDISDLPDLNDIDNLFETS